jgi:Rieske Fe-S protein
MTMTLKTILIFFLISLTNQSDLKQVANYYNGKPYGSTGYETISFWITKDDKPLIHYSYGKDDKDAPVKFISKTILKNGKRCFKITLRRNMLYVIPEGNKLRITDLKGEYNKIFSWEYQGPIDGIGTWCSVCTQDEKESLAFLKKYYLPI